MQTATNALGGAAAAEAIAGADAVLSFVWPVKGNITDGFGVVSDLRGKDNPHGAIDIAAATGTPIKATADGVVKQAGAVTNGGGNMVTISHGDGLASVYAHQSSIAVKEGDHVKKGDIIGYVGQSGFATGPHLHFGIQLNGKDVDPMKYVQP